MYGSDGAIQSISGLQNPIQINTKTTAPPASPTAMTSSMMADGMHFRRIDLMEDVSNVKVFVTINQKINMTYYVKGHGFPNESDYDVIGVLNVDDAQPNGMYSDTIWIDMQPFSPDENSSTVLYFGFDLNGRCHTI